MPSLFSRHFGTSRRTSRHVRRALRYTCALVVLTLVASTPTFAQERDESLEDEEFVVWDPLEPVNRAVFKFNDVVDQYLLEPVAEQYERVLPDPVEDGIGNFFENLRYPAYLVSDVVQLDFAQAGNHTARFLLNSTVGFLGVFDVAERWGLEHRRADFGIALASHGVPDGPYLVLPFLGPSNARDAVGRAVDTMLDPIGLGAYADLGSDVDGVLLGLGVLRVIDDRAGLLDAVKAARESSLDYYLFVQGAYYQYRKGLLTREAGSDTLEESLQGGS